MIVLKEHIVQMFWLSKRRGYLIHMWWNIALFIDDTWSDLSDMHINHETIIGVNFKKFVFRKVFGVDVVLDIAMLMR